MSLGRIRSVHPDCHQIHGDRVRPVYPNSNSRLRFRSGSREKKSFILSVGYTLAVEKHLVRIVLAAPFLFFSFRVAPPDNSRWESSIFGRVTAKVGFKYEKWTCARGRSLFFFSFFPSRTLAAVMRALVEMNIWPTRRDSVIEHTSCPWSCDAKLAASVYRIWDFG